MLKIEGFKCISLSSLAAFVLPKINAVYLNRAQFVSQRRLCIKETTVKKKKKERVMYLLARLAGRGMPLSAGGEEATAVVCSGAAGCSVMDEG